MDSLGEAIASSVWDLQIPVAMEQFMVCDAERSSRVLPPPPGSPGLNGESNWGRLWVCPCNDEEGGTEWCG